MSTFKVSVEKIAQIIPLEGADRIVEARLEGKDYRFIIQKGQFQIGDSVLYIPLDAVLPQELITKLNLEGKLSGSQKNTVKTFKLNKFNTFSEGIL